MIAKLNKHRGRAKRNSIFARCSLYRVISSVALATAIVLASGPNSNAAQTGQTASNSTAVAAARPLGANSSVVDARLRAAAEPFETLTETAFSAPVPELRKRLTKAEEALQSVRPFLDRQAASEMADHLSVLNAAATKADRALIALASIELYRVLVSSVSGKTKIPVSVSLLDYAGFRYSADLKADPIRWSDMAKAAMFAEQEWQMLAAEVASRDLASEVGRTVATMASAAEHKDTSSARRSVKAELELVDQLETHFASR